jgi:hypothetical protein
LLLVDRLVAGEQIANADSVTRKNAGRNDRGTPFFHAGLHEHILQASFIRATHQTERRAVMVSSCHFTLFILVTRQQRTLVGPCRWALARRRIQPGDFSTIPYDTHGDLALMLHGVMDRV